MAKRGVTAPADRRAARALRSGWGESMGGGIRRDHRVACSSSQDRRRGRRCSCPFSWWGSVVHGSERVRSRSFGTLAEARAAKQAQLVEARVRRALVPVERQRRADSRDGVTVFSYYSRWLKKNAERWSPNSVYIHDYMYRKHMHERFGSMLLGDLNPTMLEAWFAAVVEASGYHTAATAFRSLRGMLREAMRQRVIDWCPADAVRVPPRPDKGRRDHLTLDEYQRLVAACETTLEQISVRVAGEAGLRRGEVCALRPSSIDLDACHITVSASISSRRDGVPVEVAPKGKRTRIVAISTSLRALLAHHIEAEGLGADEYLFQSPTMGDGVPLCPATFSFRMNKLMRRAGLVNDKGRAAFRTHDLRRTAATFAQERGVAVEVIRDQLGHRKIDTTTDYYIRTHANPRLAEFSDALADIASPDNG